MLELVFLCIVLPLRIRRAASARGKSALRWYFVAAGFWVGVELLLIFLILASVTIGNVFIGIPSDAMAEKIVLLGYIVAMGSGMFAADRVRRSLESMPLVGAGALNLAAPADAASMRVRYPSFSARRRR